jgi:zinc protease
VRRVLDPSRMTRAVIRPAGGGAPAAAAHAPDAVKVAKTPLRNGAALITGVDRALPIAAIVVGFRGGVRAETDASQGLSNLVAHLLTKGTGKRTASQIAQDVESLGGSLEPFSGRDGFGLVLQLLAKDVPKGLALMRDLVADATFPEDELTIQRSLIESQLKAQEDELFDFGGRLLRQALFRTHPYRFNPLGDRKTLPSLNRQQCVEFAAAWMVPSNTVIAVFGDVDQDAVTQEIERAFGSLAAKDSPWPAEILPPPLTGIQSVSKTMDKEQALILLGFYGSRHSAPDRDAVDVMTAVLSGMSGRLFQSVRERHGLSYTLGAAHAPGWDTGSLVVYAATRPGERDRVIGVLDEQLRLAAEKGFTDDEVAQAKRYLIGHHRLDLQHLTGLAKQSVLDELYGLGYDSWSTYEARINAITVAQVNDAARKYLTLDRRAQVVISPKAPEPAVEPVAH